jgi:PAS domain S-box-containing protein
MNPMPTIQEATILIVEDDEGVALLERRALERRGFRVSKVTTGAEALDALQNGLHDLVIMDYRLPDSTTGLDLLAKIKARGYDLPIIMVTGFSNESTAIEALRQGVRDFIPKTTHYLDYLPDAVERVLKAVRTERQLTEHVYRLEQEMAERKEAEEALRQSEATTRAIVESAIDCIISIDNEGRITEFNPAAVRTFGYAREAVMGQDLAEKIIPASFRDSHRQGLLRYGATGEGRVLGKRIEITAMRADGTVFPVELAVNAVSQEGPTRFTASLRDLTERKLLEDQLRQAQKMEAVGQLAGGVAHDFNNLLTIIIGYSDVLLTDETVAAPQRADMLRQIHKAAEKAALLTRQLLAFSRKQILEPRILNLNDVVSDMEKMLRRLIGEDITVRTSLSADLSQISADAGQIEQVIMNLAVNARDAMPSGGELCIETQNTELDSSYADSHVEVKPGRYVMLAISDSGCGMDEATRARIFEPFFTTKEQGKGTGLGLATVYGIIKQSGAFIWVYSEPGQGTTFKIYFPMVEQSGERRHRGSDRHQPLRGNETILLVEDDAGVRALSRNILEMFGYTVLEAADPAEAVRICESYSGHIDALLTDVVMPHMNGRRLSELLQPQRPEMKVLFMSGYTDDAVVRQGVLQAGVNFVQKPFTPVALAGKVREVLDKNHRQVSSTTA